MLINMTVKPTQDLHEQPSANRLVLIDPQVENYQSLVASVLPNTSVVILDADRDGVEQISQALASHQGVNSLHIVSHGAPGTLYLGDSELSLTTLERYINQLQNWFPPHLLLYGCNVAAGDAGAEFITKLHQLTGANIGASTTKMGNHALGGNWDLDVIVGTFPHVQELAFSVEELAEYPSVLSLLPKGTFYISGFAYGVTVVGNYAYVADNDNGLQIIDISDPTAPSLTGTFDTSGFAYDVTVVGNYAYVADDKSGLQIIDISDPTAPSLTGTFVTSGFAEGVTVVGNYAYVAGGFDGLEIINITNPATPSLVGTLATSDFANDITVVGNYAYVADGDSGLQIIDITNPATPSLIGTFDTSGSALGISVVGNYAYVADGDSGLQIIDITNPATPSLAGTFDTSGSAFGISVVGNYAYVADEGGGLQIIDITSPATPSLAGTFDTSGSALGISVVGNYTYVADEEGGLQIINTTDPATPSLAGTFYTSGSAFGVTVAGNYAYVADEEGGLRIIDITDPTQPSLTGTFYTSGSAFGVTVVGNYAYVADNDSGLQIIDISDPTAPSLTGTFDTSGFAYDVTVVGNYAYVADDKSGLQIIDISDPTAPSLTGTFVTSGFAEGVTVVGNYAYVAGGFDGLEIINITNPATPSLVGTLATSDFANDITVVGNYAYVADGDSGLQIIDITNPATPSLIGTFDTSGSALGISVVGNYAYVADGDSGLQIIDITDPTTPFLKEAFDTSGSAFGVTVLGKYVYVADEEGGLQILENNDPPTGTDKTITIAQDSLYTFDVTDAGFNDLNGDVLTKVKITELPIAGQLFLDANNNNIQDDGEAIAPNQEILVANAAALKFKPAAGDSGSNYANIKFQVNDGTDYSVTANNLVFNVNAVTTIQLTNTTENVFTVKNNINGGKAKLSIKTQRGNSNLVNELGVFTVDDVEGTVNGIAPGATGYTEAALKRSKVILSSLANVPNGFNPNDLTDIQTFDFGANLRFFLVRNGTASDVLSGQTSSQVLFSSNTNVNVVTSAEEEFSLTWKGVSSNDTDLVVKIKETDLDLPLGIGLQGNSQGELIDLREVKTQVKADFVVNREAAFNNFIGFYKVADENGGIDTNGDGKADILVGQAGYAQAAVRGRVAGIDLTVNNQGTASYTGTFESGSIFAPFIIADGRPDALLDSNGNNDPAVYFSYLGANSDKVDHIRLLGNNIFGFEDLANGGDKDFNDVIVRVNLSIA